MGVSVALSAALEPCGFTSPSGPIGGRTDPTSSPRTRRSSGRTRRGPFQELLQREQAQRQYARDKWQHRYILGRIRRRRGLCPSAPDLEPLEVQHPTSLPIEA